MPRSVRNALILIGCLLVIGAAGSFAFLALNGAGAATAQPVTATLRVAQNDAGGLAKLTTTTPVRLSSGTTLPAGTAVSIPSITLTGALAPAPPPAIGATLRCDLTVNWSPGNQVIDIVTCTQAAPPSN